MRQLLLAAFAAITLLVAPSASATTTTTGAPCEAHSGLHSAGGCLRAEEREHLHGPLPPLTAGLPQGVDISNWQGVPSVAALRQAKAEGLRFVIIQTNDGAFGNPFFWMQAAAARAAGLPFGVYTFLEGGSGSAQAATALSMSAGTGRTLGVWGDAEQSAAYPVVCFYVAYAAAHGIHIFGVYGSPGTYAGGRCKGWAWVAVWFSPPRPLPGYPQSAIKIHQWCGTCHVRWHTGEIDRDESLGLLSLAAHHQTLHQQLVAAEALRAVLLADLHRHGCFHVHGRHAYRLCSRWGKAWRHETGVIEALRKKGAR